MTESVKPCPLCDAPACLSDEAGPEPDYDSEEPFDDEWCCSNDDCALGVWASLPRKDWQALPRRMSEKDARELVDEVVSLAGDHAHQASYGGTKRERLWGALKETEASLMRALTGKEPKP